MRAPSYLLLLPVIASLTLALPGLAQGESCAAYLKRKQVRGSLVLFSKVDKRICYFFGGKVRFAAPASYGSQEGKKRFVGDKKTPEGRYTLAPARQSKSYGLFMHISYPNAADRAYAKRFKRRPGSAIGVHGPPRRFSFLGGIVTWFNATDGCILLKEGDMRRLAKVMRRATPMLILGR
ncbi:MAG: L,D-transpeptidase family protein [Deltaproteobacteria bacterium]|nr:L,D-transpeptidase family protein [Deltaproteobacteria bacterium]